MRILGTSGKFCAWANRYSGLQFPRIRDNHLLKAFQAAVRPEEKSKTKYKERLGL
jgi:hypothetical protein